LHYFCCVAELKSEMKWQKDGDVMWADDCAFFNISNRQIGPSKSSELWVDIFAVKGDCGKRCNTNNRECTHFVFRTNPNRFCYYLKGQLNEPNPPFRALSKSLNARCGFISNRVWFSNANNVKWRYNCDFSGQGIQDSQGLLLAIPNIVTQEDCGQKCLDSSLCDHFTWSSKENICYLKRGDWPNNTPTTLADSQCGFIEGGRPWNQNGDLFWLDNCDFSGQDYKIIENFEKANCSQKCLDDPFCDHFTWKNADNKVACNLKHGVWPGNKATALDNAQCGYIPGERPWIQDGNVFWKDNCNFEADYRISIGGSNYNSALRCVQECAKSSGCTHIRYEKKNKGCQFRKGSGSEVKRAYNTDYACGYVAGNNF